MSGTTTRAPAGSAVITEPTSSDTVAPTATRVGVDADEAREGGA